MMTGHTILAVNQFDNYVSKNYHRFYDYGSRIYQGNDSFQDSVQDNLLKTRERISKSGFTGNNHLGYVWLAINNDFKLGKKKEGRRTFVDIDDDSIKDEVEQMLLTDDHNQQYYYDDLDTLVRYLFKYLDTFYDEQQSFLFKTYYLTEHNTYQKLVENSKYTFLTVKKIISQIKQDVRANLVNFTKYEVTPEVFRPVKNYEHLYQVSNKGRIKNTTTGVILKENKNNYELWKNGIRKYKSKEQLLTVFKSEDIILFKRKLK